MKEGGAATMGTKERLALRSQISTKLRSIQQRAAGCGFQEEAAGWPVEAVVRGGGFHGIQEEEPGEGSGGALRG